MSGTLARLIELLEDAGKSHEARDWPLKNVSLHEAWEVLPAAKAEAEASAARIASLEAELAAVRAQPVKDADRLDFILKKEAFINWRKRDGSILQCQLLTQDEDERFWVLSGADRYFNTDREAIDAAIAGPEVQEFL